MSGELDVSATALNVSGAFLASIAHSIEASFASASLRASCVAFQAGFIGVFTSFTFLAEQAARLSASPGCSSACGARYVLAVIAAQLAAFATAAALSARCRHWLDGFLVPRLLADAVQVRVLLLAVGLICVWVALAPSGAVADPLQLDAPQLAATSKWGDALQLGSGLLLQAAGLWLSLRLAGRGSAARPLPARSLVLWGPLRCNLAATALLLALRIPKWTQPPK